MSRGKVYDEAVVCIVIFYNRSIQADLMNKLNYYYKHF